MQMVDEYSFETEEEKEIYFLDKIEEQKYRELNYCKNQIKKNPEKWVIKEYNTVISDYKKEIEEIDQKREKIILRQMEKERGI